MAIRALPFLLLALAACGAQARCANGSGVAAVDLRRTLNETNAGRLARKTLEEHRMSVQDLISERQAEAKRAENELERDRPTLAPEALAWRERRVQAEQESLKRLLADASKALEIDESALDDVVIARAGDAIKTIAERQGYGRVIDANEGKALCPVGGESADPRTAIDITAAVNRLVDERPERAAPADVKVVPMVILELWRIGDERDMHLPTDILAAVRGKGRLIVLIKLCVAADGIPSAVVIGRSSGRDDVDRFAVARTREWRFRPFLVEGRAMPVCSVKLFRWIVS